MSEGRLISEQFQEIIVDNSRKSFNQGHNHGVLEERLRIMEIIKEHTVSATSMIDGTVIEGITITPSELLKLVSAN